MPDEQLCGTEVRRTTKHIMNDIKQSSSMVKIQNPNPWVTLPGLYGRL